MAKSVRALYTLSRLGIHTCFLGAIGRADHWVFKMPSTNHKNLSVEVMKRNVQLRLKFARWMKGLWTVEDGIAAYFQILTTHCRLSAKQENNQSHLGLRKQNILADQMDGIGVVLLHRSHPCLIERLSVKRLPFHLPFEAIERLNFNFRSLIEKVESLIALRVFTSRMAIDQPCEGRFGTQKFFSAAWGMCLEQKTN